MTCKETDATATSEYTQQIYQGSTWVPCMQQIRILCAFLFVFLQYTVSLSWSGVNTNICWFLFSPSLFSPPSAQQWHHTLARWPFLLWLSLPCTQPSPRQARPMASHPLVSPHLYSKSPFITVCLLKKTALHLSYCAYCAWALWNQIAFDSCSHSRPRTGLGDLVS